jgi:16S rRNA (guanine527-N7)-methyltransferase
MEAGLREILLEGASRMGVVLGEEAVARFDTLLALLQTWGSRVNLTTRIEAREVVIHHFLDSLAGVPLLSGTPVARVLDLGAGAGFPAFPLKFALPELRVTLVESVRKKIAFCREVIRASACTEIEAVCARGEELGSDVRYRGAYDWVVSRALGSSANVLRLSLPFLVPGGGILLYKGMPDRKELDDLEVTCGKLAISRSLHEATVPFLEARRTLIVLKTAGC